jgi:hypothetical protein
MRWLRGLSAGSKALISATERERRNVKVSFDMMHYCPDIIALSIDSYNMCVWRGFGSAGLA